MIWVFKPMDTTAGWVGWCQEFRDQLCSRGFGSEKKQPLRDTNPERFSIKSVVPIFVPNLDPSNLIVILPLHSVSMDCKYWIG